MAADYFILYEDGIELCRSSLSASFVLNCSVEIDGTGDPLVFTMTAVDYNNFESPHSAPFSLTTPKEIDSNYQPKAVIVTSSGSGNAPLNIIFDGGSSVDLDGDIVNYSWKFSDGLTVNGEIVHYTFLDAGEYSVELSVTDDRFAVSSTTIIISVAAPSQSSSLNEPPVAKINAIAVGGYSSLVHFDGNESYDFDGTIEIFEWGFSDGSFIKGREVDYDFISLGDHLATLTVTDDEGAIGNTQVVVTVVDSLSSASDSGFSWRDVSFAWEYSGNRNILTAFRLYRNGEMICETTDVLASEIDCAVLLDELPMNFYVTALDDSGMESQPSNLLEFRPDPI